MLITLEAATHSMENVTFGGYFGGLISYIALEI